MGWAAAVPEKKGDKPFVTNKFLLNLVSGGTAAAIAKTATASIGGNIAGVARYAPSQALNFAFYDLYKNAVNYVFPLGENEKMGLFRFSTHCILGGLAGVTTLGITHSLEHAFTRGATHKVHTRRETRYNYGVRSHKEGFLDRIWKIKGFPFLYSYSVTFIRFAYFGYYESNKNAVVVTSGQKLNFFSSLPLALVATSYANISTTAMHVFGQVFVKHPEPKRFHEYLMNKSGLFIVNEGRSVQLIAERYGFMRFAARYSIGYMKLVFKKEGYAKQFAFRSLTGALVLAGYDEIQMWLR